MYQVLAVKPQSRVTAESQGEKPLRIEFVSGRGRGLDYFALILAKHTAAALHAELGRALKPQRARRTKGRS